MLEFLSQLFDTSDFPARWQCGRWSDGHGWLHILSDLAIWAAYVAIPCVIGFFVIRKKDVPFRAVFLLFGAFILACSATHLIEAILFWWPAYRLAGVMKLVTAIVSWGTVFALVPVMPRALAMRNPEELEHEIRDRKHAEEVLRSRSAELHGAQHALKASEARLAAILNSATDAILSIDDKQCIIFFNPAAERMFGRSSAEMLGRPIECLLPERYRATHGDDIRQFGRTGTTTRRMGALGSVSGLRADGREFPIEASIAQSEVAGQKMFTVILRDITERQRAEQRFRQAVESSPNGMVMIDAAGKIVLVNAQTQRLFGYGREELLGQPVELLVPERFRGQHPGSREAFFAAPQVRSMGVGRDLYGRRKDGSEFPVEIGLNPIKTEDGLMVLSSIIDITERKRAEVALRESERFARSTLDSLSAHIAILDETGTILAVNESWRAFAGENNASEPISERVNYLDVCDRASGPYAEQASDVAAGIRAVVAGTVPQFTAEYPCHSPTEQRWFIVRLTPFSGDGPRRVVVAHENITARKQMESALRQNEAQLAADLRAMTELQAVGALFVQEGDLSAVLDPILTTAIAIAGADLGNIQLFDPQSRSLRIVAHQGFEQPFLDFWSTVHEGEGACGTALRQGDRVIVEDVTQSPIFLGKPALEVMLQAGARAVQATTLRSRSGRMLGIFSTHYKAPCQPGDRALRLLDILARQAADILDRAETEAALRTSENSLRLALDAARMGTYDWDVAGNRIVWSRWHEELWGYAPGEFDGTFESFARRVHPEDLPGVNAEVERCLATRERYVCEFRVVWPDESVHWINGTGEFEFGADGRPIRMRGMVMETTARKKAEEALRRSRDDLESRVQERTEQLSRSNTALESAMDLTRQHSAQMHGLAEAALAMNSAQTLNGVLQVITDQARHIIGAHQAVTSFTRRLSRD